MGFTSILKRSMVAAAGVALVSSAAAAQIAGTVSVNGFLRFTSAGGLFIQILDGGSIDFSAGNGSFAVLNGTTGTMANFSPAAGPVAIPSFITGGPFTFDLAQIFPGFGPPGTCTTAGVICTPAGTGITLTNNPVAGTSAASLSFGGSVTDGMDTSPFTGVLTAQFTQSYQQVIANLATTGFIETSFSGTLTAAPAVVPEPSTYALMATGLGLLGGVAARRRRQA